MAKKVKIGKVVDAYWDKDSRAIRFTMEFVNGAKMKATCPAGYDATSGVYIPSDKLQAKAKKFVGMTIYDQSGQLDPKRLTRDDLAKLRFNISLSNMDIDTSIQGYSPDVNTFLSRLF